MENKFDTLPPEQQAAIRWKAREHCQEAHAISGELGQTLRSGSDMCMSDREFHQTVDNLATASPAYLQSLVEEHKAALGAGCGAAIGR